MGALKGSLMLIKVGDGAVSESFTTLGGLRVTRLMLNQAAMDTTAIGSGAWRMLANETGPRRMSVEGMGLFTDAASEERVRDCAFSGRQCRFRLYFGNGDYVQGAFLISQYERSAAHDSEQLYALRLESAGELLFVAG
ncbi:MAG: phage tail protein [Rickettsiales bacterium]|nr:phage tail protein [Rickettsiales bacterium]